MVYSYCNEGETFRKGSRGKLKTSYYSEKDNCVY